MEEEVYIYIYKRGRNSTETINSVGVVSFIYNRTVICRTYGREREGGLKKKLYNIFI